MYILTDIYVLEVRNYLLKKFFLFFYIYFYFYLIQFSKLIVRNIGSCSERHMYVHIGMESTHVTVILQLARVQAERHSRNRLSGFASKCQLNKTSAYLIWLVSA